ncbi:hypothetical protein L1987_02305 [Smallanthus sonchifolius]|uniref:Uncharacterized protein n=1 Tax=Smallanthus sonchifolius TaxID=185202 RepID=A0ACB9K7K2_9ASTR|nr:hypothetical protein L1987_02305 [Smallanthus sonchifolius]
MAAALAAMANEIKELKLSAQRCEVCGGGQDTRDCPVNHQAQVSFTGNQNQNRGYNNYNNSYGSGWSSGNNPPGFNARPNQYGGAEAGATLGSSVSTRKIEEMGVPSSDPNASVMAVSIGSHREEEKASHSADYRIPSPEEVKKVD